MNAVAALQSRERIEKKARREQDRTKRRQELDRLATEESPWETLRREWREDLPYVLMGADTRVYPQGWMKSKNLSLEQRRAVIKDPQAKTMWSVVKFVCDVFCIQPEEIWQVGKQRVFAARRAIVADIIRRVDPTASLPKIGRLLKRDHTTIMYAIKNLPRYLEEDPQLAELHATCCSHFGIKP